jgi:hypothetical protein
MTGTDVASTPGRDRYRAHLCSTKESFTTPIPHMRADWTLFEACTSGSTAYSKDVMRPASGGGVMTNTKSTGVSNEGHRKTIL